MITLFQLLKTMLCLFMQALVYSTPNPTTVGLLIHEPAFLGMGQMSTKPDVYAENWCMKVKPKYYQPDCFVDTDGETNVTYMHF